MTNDTYDVVERTELLHLVQAVNAMKAEGWEPLGGVCVVNDAAGVFGRMVFYQAMIRPMPFEFGTQLVAGAHVGSSL